MFSGTNLDSSWNLVYPLLVAVRLWSTDYDEHLLGDFMCEHSVPVRLAHRWFVDFGLWVCTTIQSVNTYHSKYGCWVSDCWWHLHMSSTFWSFTSLYFNLDNFLRPIFQFVNFSFKLSSIFCLTYPSGYFLNFNYYIFHFLFHLFLFL